MVRGVLAAGAVWLAIAGPASAAEEPSPVGRGEWISEEQLVPGGGVAWMDVTCVTLCPHDSDGVDRSTVYVARRDGSKVRRLLRRTYSVAQDDGVVTYGFSLSRQGLAVVRDANPSSRYFSPPSTYKLAFGPVTGPLGPIGGCSVGRPFAVDGPTLFYVEYCADAVRLIARRVDGTVVWTQAVRRAEQRFVGVRARRGYVLLELQAPGGTISLALLRGADGAELGRWDRQETQSASLGDGGDVLFAEASPTGCALAGIQRPGSPQRVAIPLAACPSSSPHLVGGRVWYPTTTSSGTRILSTGPGGDTRVHVDLGPLPIERIVVDERSVGWLSPAECDGRPALRVVPVRSHVSRPAGMGCPVELARRRVPTSRPGSGTLRARVELRCPSGCRGELGLRRSGAALHERTVRFRQSGVRGVHRIPLGARARRALRTHGRLRATVRVRRFDRVGRVRPPRDLPVTVLRTATFTR